MKKRSRVSFVCDRRVLVKQASKRFAKYGIPHGVAMGKDTFGRSMPVQICSAQTIEKRDYWNNLDILIIDEAHAQRKQILEFAKAWGGPVIGLTATPMTPGLGKWYSHVVNAVSTNYLLSEVNPREGRTYLAPLRIYPPRPWTCPMPQCAPVSGRMSPYTGHPAASSATSSASGNE